MVLRYRFLDEVQAFWFIAKVATESAFPKVDGFEFHFSREIVARWDGTNPVELRFFPLVFVITGKDGDPPFLDTGFRVRPRWSGKA